MQLQVVPIVDSIAPQQFADLYYAQQKPVVIKDLAKQWPAYTKWNWAYFKELVGHKKVGIYNNIKSDAYTPINTADDYMTFGEYIDMLSLGPSAWRIFLFNIFDHAPRLVKNFSWPDHLMKGFVKKYPMLFVGGIRLLLICILILTCLIFCTPSSKAESGCCYFLSQNNTSCTVSLLRY